MFNDYDKIISKAGYKAEKGTGLKIITPKKILQKYQ